MDNPSLQGIADKTKIFDAFPKVDTSYTTRSTRGGLLTLILVASIFTLIWTELQDFTRGIQKMKFVVDKQVSSAMQINLDITVAMPCHFLNVDVNDFAGDRLHVSDMMVKEATEFHLKPPKSHSNSYLEDSDVRQVIGQSRRGRRKFLPGKISKVGTACRLYGNIDVNKVMANLHITALGHGYGWVHTDHSTINFTHTIHELSFGEFFPSLVNPLDNVLEVSDHHFQLFQYFLSLIPTTYIDSLNRVIHTYQYAVTERRRTVQEGSMQEFPGIVFMYDLEPLSLTIHDESIGLLTFLVRLSGVIGGVITCSAFAYRIFDRILLYFFKNKKRSGRIFSSVLDKRSSNMIISPSISPNNSMILTPSFSPNSMMGNTPSPSPNNLMSRTPLLSPNISMARTPTSSPKPTYDNTSKWNGSQNVRYL